MTTKQQAEIKRLRKFEHRAGDHPLVMEEGGLDNADRCHRVIDKQEREIARLRKREKRLIHELKDLRRVYTESLEHGENMEDCAKMWKDEAERLGWHD